MAAMTKIAKELGGRAISVEFDRDYYRCILQGDWGGAVGILERALKKAKEKEND